MKCPACYWPGTRVLETREGLGGVTRRRRECLECGEAFTTEELPPKALSYINHNLSIWKDRQTSEYKNKVRQRTLLAPKMREDRARGDTCQQIADRYGVSIHMARKYTQPSAKERT